MLYSSSPYYGNHRTMRPSRVWMQAHLSLFRTRSSYLHVGGTAGLLRVVSRSSHPNTHCNYCLPCLGGVATFKPTKKMGSCLMWLSTLRRCAGAMETPSSAVPTAGSILSAARQLSPLNSFSPPISMTQHSLSHNVHSFASMGATTDNMGTTADGTDRASMKGCVRCVPVILHNCQYFDDVVFIACQ